MNQDGCPPLWATDEILTFNPVKQPCGLLIPVWLLFLSIACVCRLLIAVRHWAYWFARQRREYKRTLTSPSERSKRDNRLPLVPVISLLVATMQMVFVTLVSTNTISSRNGVSAVIAVLWFHPQKFLNELFALKLIRLGKRISPARPKASSEQGQIVMVHDDASHAAEEQNKRLTTWDDLHRFLLLVWFVSMIGQFISTVILCTVQPTPQLEAFRAFVIFDVLISISSIGTQIHQLSRVIGAIKVHTAIVKSINNIGTYQNSINQAIKRLEHQRRVIYLLAIPLFAIHGYLIVTLDFPWYLILTFCYLEFTSIYLVSRSMNVRHPQNHVATTTSNVAEPPKDIPQNNRNKSDKLELTGGESQHLHVVPSDPSMAEIIRPVSSGVAEISGNTGSQPIPTGLKVEDSA